MGGLGSYGAWQAEQNREAQEYIGKLEARVKALEAKAKLADEMHAAFLRWRLEAQENNEDFQDWQHDWRRRYALLATPEAES